VNAWFGNWVPVFVVALFGAGLFWTNRFDVPTWRLRRWPSLRN
jgi:hypothetical protein